MRFANLVERDYKALDEFLGSGQITTKTLPRGAAVCKDSMDPFRNPVTDQLHPGVKEGLGEFSDVAIEYGLALYTATNGPKIEGEDILRSLKGPVSALAVVEGGGVAIFRHPRTGLLEYRTLADPQEVGYLEDLEAYVSDNPLMKALLGNREATDGYSPIRTPYQTNTVTTIPNNYDILDARLKAVGVSLEQELPGINPRDHVKGVLDFVYVQYMTAISHLGLGDRISALIKAPNRRVYVTPRHNYLGVPLSKGGSVELTSILMALKPEYNARPTSLTKWIYIADKLVDIGGEGQPILGSSEKSMVKGGSLQLFEQPPKNGLTNLREVQLDETHTIFVANVMERVARLGMDVARGSMPPRMDRVEDVDIMHVDTGPNALGVLAHLYDRLYM